MTAEELKHKIRERFGSQAKFCEQIRLNPKTLSARLKNNDPDMIELMNKMVDKVSAKDDRLISKELRLKIYNSIIEKYGSIKAFSEKCTEFNQFSLYQIINGIRKTKNDTVKHLIKKLKIE